MCWLVQTRPYRWFFSAIATILITSGCTTVRPTDLPRERLQEKIISGEIIKPGDYATIITADGKRHSLKVLTITEQSVTGEHHIAVEGGPRDENTFEDTEGVVAETIDIPITDIVGVETKEATIFGYTGAVTGGFAIGYLFMAFLVAFPLLILGL